MTNNIFLVGGAVRDIFIGRPNKDKDYAVEAESFDAMRQIVFNKGGKIFVENPEFLTIRANVPELGSADYVLCRKDGAYRDGRHPDSVEVGTIEDDLARRDFTMNAIAINTADEFDVRDPHRGIDDIAFKMIRCVGDAVTRFEEDKLRIFRALRFSVTLGFTMDDNCTRAIREFSLPSAFDAVSTERIREELLKMFEKDSFFSVHLLNTFGVLRTVIESRGIWFKPTLRTKVLTNHFTSVRITP